MLDDSMASAAARGIHQPPSLEQLVSHGLEDARAPTLLFGSHARGNARPESDIDVLQLASSSRAYETGALSVTVYRPEDLRKMATRGSLFVLHLRHDGIVLHDPGTDDTMGVLEQILKDWRPPSSYAPLHQALRITSGALATEEHDFHANPKGFLGLAIFLARTELYARCAATGDPEFCVVRAAERCGRAALGRTLDQRRRLAPSWDRFVALRESIQRALDLPCHNPYGSLEALVVHIDALTPVGATVVLRTIMNATAIGYHLMPPDDLPW